MVTVAISASKPGSLTRKLPEAVTFDKPLDAVTILDVKKAIAAKNPKFYTSRQKLSLKGDNKALPDGKTLKEVGVTGNAELSVKDLGPQIGWKTVFVIEYAGPLVIHPLIYYLPQLFYGGPVQHSTLQTYVYAGVMFHFIKRELETLFIHRFSHGTMPFRNVFKNSAHYHLLSGLLLAYAIYSPTYSANSPWIRGTIRENPTFLMSCMGAFLFAELSNLSTHLTLRNLRPAGTTTRAIPMGYGFSLVSCPNYLFETIAWTAITVMTGSWAAALFWVVGTGQMAVWAKDKHRNYKKQFGDKYPRGRKAMFPFVF
ncbi:3-oxo-5-alpha-steroid 4-dehydrogenase-domain-containing protein [Epithele typhae]|uniref:3-oxo-5-alpha-steroid 4-dehydrogenase-domain-containing protein n=1 Tax=Epithele typhae TaxID=378194 RepID=UPI0020082D7A|nr:3-oxo-5-alpha-steroid 4-dehydrogenase-domain-containing protein [Epithele typhae]KAH9945415.1 3-oxo-5-alpha-steroid 4-dehydrogenase-domain-containing protein [Epithele typhae]